LAYTNDIPLIDSVYEELRRLSMNDVLLNEELEREKEKLYKLANEARRKGIPLTQDEDFMAQNQKVDVLVAKVQYSKSVGGY
jgi:hypothetical protein